MKKALFFILEGVGGAERMTIEIAKILIQLKWQIRFCKIHKVGNEIQSKVEDFIPNGCEIVTIQNISQTGLLRQIVSETNEYKPDLIFSSAIHINLRILLLKSILSTDRIVVRNDNYLYTLPVWKRQLVKFLYNRAGCIIAQTDEMKKELVRFGIKANKIEILQNFVSQDVDSKASENNPFSEFSGINFVASGRFHYDKGFDVLAKSFSLVRQILPDAHLWILGDNKADGGKIESEIIQLAQDEDWLKNLHIVGFTTNPYKYVKHADVFVLSSRNEGLPNVLIEAQHLGTACAATRCIPVISRIIMEGVNGYLSDSDNPESLADAMINASELGRVKMTFKTADQKDVLNIFNQ